MTRRYALTALLAAFAALLLITGCGEDARTPVQPGDEAINGEPTRDDYDLVAEDLSYALTDPSTGMLAMWAAPPEFDGGTPRDGGDHPEREQRDFGSLHDTTIVHPHGETVFDFTFFDAEDNPSESYDPESTVRMLRLMTMTGQFEDEHHSRSLAMESTLDLDQIAPDDEVRIINETGQRTEQGEMTGRFEEMQRTIDASHEWLSDDVNVHVDHEAHPYPLSGTVTHHTTLFKTATNGDWTRTFELDVTSTITFDGTQWALVSMDDGSEYLINLDNGRCRRGPRP